jgi:hypothetical protein
MRFLNSVYFKVLAFLFIGFLMYLECVVNHNKDFDVFVNASRLIFNGQTCYDVWIHVGTSGLKYYYSPLFAVLLFPIKDMPQVAYHFIWLSLNLILIYRIFKLLPVFLNLKKISPKQRDLFYILTLLVSARFLYDAFSLGQMSFVLVWGSLEVVRLIRAGKLVHGAAILALIINIKLIPIAILAYLFYTKELKAASYTLLFFLLYLFLPAIFIGNEFNTELLRQWLGSITSTNTNSIMDDYGRQSLSSFVPAMFMNTPLQFNLKRNLLDLSPQTVNLILTVIRLFFLALLVYLFGKPFRKTRTKKELFYHVALICLATPLFFPHQGKYSFFYLLPAQAYCMYALIKLNGLMNRIKYRRYYKITGLFFLLSFVLLTLTTDGLIGRRLSDFCEYLQFITIGTFSLLLAMLSLKPKANTTYQVSKF